MKERRNRAILALTFWFWACSLAAQQNPEYLFTGGTGYIYSNVQTTFPGYGLGATWYTSSWPLLDKPLADVRLGFVGTWFIPDNYTFPQILCPPGTTARDQFYTGTGNLSAYFETIEGGVGIWGGSSFPTGNPKIHVVGTGTCYSGGQSGEGFGFAVSGGSIPCGQMGIAQLSNRLLMPIDSPVLVTTNGNLLGYGYMALPLFGARSNNGTPTGDQTWTLFLNSANFKGPAVIWLPDYWSDLSRTYPTDVGRGLDTLDALLSGIAAEYGFFPRFRAVGPDQTVYSRYPAMHFPVDSHSQTVLQQDIHYYSDQALYAALKTWVNGGSPVPAQFQSAGSTTPQCTKDPGAGIALQVQGDNETAPLALDSIVKATNSAASVNGCAVTLQWTPTATFPAGALPEYYKQTPGSKALTPILASDVPASLSLQSQTFPLAKTGSPLTVPTANSSCWVNPGPAAGPFYANLADGSTVTYFWYRFVDQPAIQRMNLSTADQQRIQTFVASMHSHWTPDLTYMSPPSSGSLASLDPALVVTPPAGLEVGYVPVVADQRASAPPYTGASVIQSGPTVAAPGSLITLQGQGLGLSQATSSVPAIPLGGVTAWIDFPPARRLRSESVDVVRRVSIPMVSVSQESIQFYLHPTLPLGPAVLALTNGGPPLSWPLDLQAAAPQLMTAQGTIALTGASTPVSLGLCGIVGGCTPATLPSWTASSGPATLTLVGTGFRKADPAQLSVRIGWTVYPVQSISDVNQYGLDSVTVNIAQPPAAGFVDADVLAGNTLSQGSAVLSFAAQPVGGQAVDGARAMAADGSGNVYWADQAAKKVNRITPLGASSTVYVTNSTSVTGLAVDSAGLTLYVNDGGQIVRVSIADGKSVVLVAGGAAGGPWGIALDEKRNALYIAANGSARVLKFDLSSNTLTTIAGTGKRSSTCNRGSGVPALQADLGSPIAVAVAPDGSVYFGDDTASCLERIAPNGTLTTIAGNGTTGRTADGAPAAGSPIGLARGITVDSSGNVMFAESVSGLIRGIDSAGNLTTVIAGLSGPFAAQLDALGYYYLLETGAATITRYPPGPNTTYRSPVAAKSP